LPQAPAGAPDDRSRNQAKQIEIYARKRDRSALTDVRTRRNQTTLMLAAGNVVEQVRSSISSCLDHVFQLALGRSGLEPAKMFVGQGIGLCARDFSPSC
jgi:hypothetical protein